MCTYQSKKIWLNVISVSVILGVSAVLLFSCGAGVDIGKADRVLTSFQIVWPGDFTDSCITGVPVPVTIRALDQNGKLFTSWNGTVSIEKDNPEVTLSHDSVEIANGSTQIPLSFTVTENQTVKIRVRYDETSSSWSSEITVQDVFGAGISPLDGSLLVGHEPIVVTFNATADDSIFSFTGIGDYTVDWAPDYKSVTLIPSTFWNEGDGQPVTLYCEAAADEQTFSDSYTFDVFHGVCVSGSTGSSDNIGSPDLPLDTIRNGIIYADVTAGYTQAVVRVAAEAFTVDWAGNTNRIEMAEGISLYGEYAGDFQSRTLTSSIEDTSSSGGTESSPNCAIYCGSGITSGTIIDGFVIKPGKNDSFAASGIFCDGGSPTIQNNTITGRLQAEAPHYAACITAVSASPVIKNNTLETKWNSNNSDLASTSYGVYCDGASPNIDGNTIHGGLGYNTYGVYFMNISSGTVQNSPSIDCGYGSNKAHCVSVWSSSPSIVSNSLKNSGFISHAYGVYEKTAASDPATVESNDFSFDPYAGTGAWYYDEGATNVRDLTPTTVTTGKGDQTLTYWENYSSFL